MTTQTMTLDAAWAEAEAALPAGWYVRGVSIRPGLQPDERWESSAWGHAREERTYVYGPSPAASLHALAVALRESRS